MKREYVQTVVYDRTVRVQVYVEPATRERIKVVAAMQGISMVEAAKQLVEAGALVLQSVPQK